MDTAHASNPGRRYGQSLTAQRVPESIVLPGRGSAASQPSIAAPAANVRIAARVQPLPSQAYPVGPGSETAARPRVGSAGQYAAGSSARFTGTTSPQAAARMVAGHMSPKLSPKVSGLAQSVRTLPVRTAVQQPPIAPRRSSQDPLAASTSIITATRPAGTASSAVRPSPRADGVGSKSSSASHNALFTRLLADTCPHCDGRPGIVMGLRGFGWREKGHEHRCAARQQKQSAGIVDEEGFLMPPMEDSDTIVGRGDERNASPHVLAADVQAVHDDKSVAKEIQRLQEQPKAGSSAEKAENAGVVDEANTAQEAAAVEHQMALEDEARQLKEEAEAQCARATSPEEALRRKESVEAENAKLIQEAKRAQEAAEFQAVKHQMAWAEARHQKEEAEAQSARALAEAKKEREAADVIACSLAAELKEVSLAKAASEAKLQEAQKAMAESEAALASLASQLSAKEKSLEMALRSQAKAAEERHANDNRKPILRKTRGKVPVYVMLPLNWMSEDGQHLMDQAMLRRQLTSLKQTGISGVMADVWWGRCEPEPGRYRFGATRALCALIRDLQMELQLVMSFHRCGGNVGDAVTMPLPSWVLGTAREHGLLYRSEGGVESEDCLSLSADHAAIFPSNSQEGKLRTALQLYADYMTAVLCEVQEDVGTTVTELQVGCGPCGELRYPSYMLSNGWRYPGVGLVMAYDTGMLRMLQEAGLQPPDGLPADQNAGPDSSPMFRVGIDPMEAGYRRAGKEFLKWYSDVLVAHGRQVLSAAGDALNRANLDGRAPELRLSVKISGIHWHTMHPSRASEACAGYDNCSDDSRDAYKEIAKMLRETSRDIQRPVIFNFTCVEMTNWSNGLPQNEDHSAAEDLISQVRRACVSQGVSLAGENALEFDIASSEPSLTQIRKQLRNWSQGKWDTMHGVTLLRLNEGFTRPESLRQLGDFIARI